MSLQIKFVPNNPPTGQVTATLSKGNYATNPPWHQVQQRLVGTSRYPTPYTGPLDQSSILAAARFLSGSSIPITPSPTSAGNVKINGNDMGTFDYRKVGTNTTISSFRNADWFTTTQDTASAWVIVNGNLTINSGVTMIPTNRKLFLVVYVSGNCTINGAISMTSRGANHSGTGTSGGYTAPVDIRIGTGTFGAVVDPQIPAAGGTGASGRTTAGGNSGTDGTNGQTGGGGGGYWYISGSSSGGGSGGTCFAGGSGGGAAYSAASPAESGGANGGKGGAALGSYAGGGSGNPGGAGAGGAPNGNAGNGGTIIVICEGALSGSGNVTSLGVQGGDGSGVIGGGSGAGSVNVLYGTNPSGISVNATNANFTGRGGNGTARKLAIGAN